MQHYSCDSHVVEPREVFSGLEPKFGSRAPQVVSGFAGRPGDFVMLPGAPPIPVGRFGIAGSRLDDPATHELREAYAMRENTVSDGDNRRAMTAFFFWTAWATGTDRPGYENRSYTNNWPYEPLIGNKPTSDNFIWSVFSILFLIGGVGNVSLPW